MSTGNVVVSQDAPAKNNLWIQPKGTARFWNGSFWKTISGSGGGGDYLTREVADGLYQSLSGMNSYLTKTEALNTYLTIDFFEHLFELHSGASGNPKINANSTITGDTSNYNIKAMFGFWTEQYISALGQNSSGGGGGGGDLDWESLTTWDEDPEHIININYLPISLSNGTITIGSNSITPLTSHQDISGKADKATTITGTNGLSGGGTLEQNRTIGLDSTYKTKIDEILSMFELDSNGDVKTKDKPNNGGHRGFYSESFISALGTNSSGGGGGGMSESDLWIELTDNSGWLTTDPKVIARNHLPINGASGNSGGQTFFAPINGGSVGQFLISNGNSAPSWHTLAASDIPNLSASKITSGTFDAARIPTLSITDKTSGTLPINRGGTGATTRLGALQNLTNENVGTSAQYFLTITENWGKGGYTSVANVKSVLGLGSNAYTSTAYLPLSGGTMTGNLVLKGNQYNREGALNCNNSDIIGVNSILTQNLAENFGECIGFYRSSTTYDCLSASNGTFYFGSNKVYGDAFVGDAEIRCGSINGLKTKTFYTIDATSLSSSNFYPVIFPAGKPELDCEISSVNSTATYAYNCNRIHYFQTGQGWGDEPIRLTIFNYGQYDSNEITIGCIGHSTHAGQKCVWVRGGISYQFYCNAVPSLKTTSYTAETSSQYGNVVFSVGSNYSGGTNSGVSIDFNPTPTYYSYFQSPYILGSSKIYGDITIGGNNTSNIIDLLSTQSRLKFFAFNDGKCYIESGNANWTSSADMSIAGVSNNNMNNLYLKANETSCSKNLSVNGVLNVGGYLGLTQTTGAGVGISLCGTPPSSGAPTYGIMFARTDSYGEFGDVKKISGSSYTWATYFTMGTYSTDVNRGWIFRNVTSGNNVASLSTNGNFCASGGVTALVATSSDKRLKKDIKPFNAKQIIDKLKPVEFEWNKKANKYNSNLELNKKNYGLIAQDSDGIIDNLVFDLPDGKGYKGVRYEKLIPILLQAIKEQNEKIEDLEYEINVLKGVYK